jgi:hypothetical protein
VGVTVHFEGALSDESSFRRIIVSAQEFAMDRNWSTSLIDEAKAKLQRVRGDEDWDYEGPTRGIALQPHPNCDPLRLEFDSDLYIQEYCKTQFAPSRVHMEIVELLRILQPEFRSLSVLDEGEYWDTADESRLESHLSACFKALDEHLERDPNLMGPVRAPSGRILDLVTRR